MAQTIAEPGSDADLVLVNRSETTVVQPETLLYRHHHTPYLGRTLAARVVQTLLRGETVFAGGQIVAAVVSGKPAKDFPDAAVFPRLEDAVEKLPHDTTFFIATPPALHFDQAKLVLQRASTCF